MCWPEEGWSPLRRTFTLFRQDGAPRRQDADRHRIRLASAHFRNYHFLFPEIRTANSVSWLVFVEIWGASREIPVILKAPIHCRKVCSNQNCFARLYKWIDRKKKRNVNVKMSDYFFYNYAILVLPPLLGQACCATLEWDRGWQRGRKIKMYVTNSLFYVTF